MGPPLLTGEQQRQACSAGARLRVGLPRLPAVASSPAAAAELPGPDAPEHLRAGAASDRGPARRAGVFWRLGLPCNGWAAGYPPSPSSAAGGVTLHRRSLVEVSRKGVDMQPRRAVRKRFWFRMYLSIVLMGLASVSIRAINERQHRPSVPRYIRSFGYRVVSLTIEDPPVEMPPGALEVHAMAKVPEQPVDLSVYWFVEVRSNTDLHRIRGGKRTVILR